MLQRDAAWLPRGDAEVAIHADLLAQSYSRRPGNREFAQ
jgi:hypothetical protein